jgi:hypothetical protein
MVPQHQTHLVRSRPGITGAASLAFRNEEVLLGQIPEHLLDAYQVNVLMPLKKKLDDNYMREATLLRDLVLLCRTVTSKGDVIRENDLRRFQASLVSLNSALTTEDNRLQAVHTEGSPHAQLASAFWPMRGPSLNGARPNHEDYR